MKQAQGPRYPVLRDLCLMASIATRAYFHDRTPSVCTLLGLAAILAPLFVLFGLKYGVVSALRDRLETDPRMRVIQPIGQGSYDKAWFDALAARPETGFLVPTTRFLAATMSLRNAARPDFPSVSAEMWPTAPGDPLLSADTAARLASQADGRRYEVAISQGVAEQLGLAGSAPVEGRIGRTFRGEPEIVSLELAPSAILSAASLSRDVVLVPLALLEATEDYREGEAVPAFGAEGQPHRAGPRLYASFRLYARTIDNVAVLRAWLADHGIQTVTRLADIEMVQSLDRDLGRLFLVISSLGAGGYLVSMALGLWASVARQRRALSLLRLVGFPTIAISLFPVFQGLWAATLSLIVAGLATWMTVPLVGRLMASQLPQGAQIFRLLPEHVGVAAAVTLLCTIAAASYGGMRAAAIPPADGLRDE